jgi:hypothetical protein
MEMGSVSSKYTYLAKVKKHMYRSKDNSLC